MTGFGRRKGFTLIEVICVLAIISILAGIQKLDLNGFVANIKLKFATRELINDLRYAKMYAVSNDNSTVKLLFQGETTAYHFSSYKIYDPSKVNGTIKEVKLKENIIIDGIKSTFYGEDGEKFIIFNFNGSVSPACTIALKDTINNKYRYVTLTIGYTRAMEVTK